MKPETRSLEESGPPAEAKPPLDLERLRIHRADEVSVRRPFPWGRLFLLFLLLLGAGAASWFLHFGIPVVETVRAVVEVPEGAGGVVLTATGYVVARKTANVGSKTAGRIEAILVEEGSPVKGGEVIAQLEAKEQEASLAEARANLADARRELDRVTKLAEGGAAGSQEVDAARARLEVVEAQRALAEAELANTVVRAPFDGTVIARPAEVGETISFGVVAGQVSAGVIVTIADLTDLEVDTDVNEANIGRVREGQPAEVVLEAYPDVRFRAVVRKIMPRAVRRTSAVPVRAKILDADPRVRPDMSAKVHFGADGSAGSSRATASVFVPPGAILEKEGSAFVRVVRGGRAFALPIRAGLREAARVEVLEGLSGGEEVVAAGGRDLEDGARVRPAPRP